MTRADAKIKKELIANYIHSLETDNYTLQSIADKFKVGTPLIKSAIAEYGVKPPKREFSKPMADRDAGIIKDYENGLTLQNIGEKYGISKQRVYQVLLREGKVNHNKNTFKPHTKGSIVFDGLRNWMNENKITDAEFSYKLSQKLGNSITPTRLNSLFRNYDYINYKTIVAILDITGLTFENCFYIE